MSKIFYSTESVRLRQEIISQCVWSDTYSSLKHILKRTAYQLPLLVSFLNTDDEQQTTAAATDNYQTIFFFERNISNKLLFTPLQQHDHYNDQFDVHPKHCTFAITDLYKGLFEFVRNGQRSARVYTNLEQLIAFTSTLKCSIVFMSRDRTLGYYQDPMVSQWLSKEYPQGAIFRAERVHRSFVSTNDGHRIPNDYLECNDEDGYTVFIKTDQSGRFSIISTSIEQQQDQPEIYLHSTQTPNIGQLIKYVTVYNDNNNNCIRLLRGPVPNDFLCQYFQLVRQHTYDVLVGLTQEGLVIEMNLDSHIPCRYATNLNDILNSIYGSTISQTLESHIEQARIHYKENIQLDLQLVSTIDWAAFFQYWKSTGKLRRKYNDEKTISYQSRHRFQLVASVQDLSEHPRTLASAFRKYHNLSTKENLPVQNRKSHSDKQHSLLSQMSRLIPTSKHSKRHHSHRNPQSSVLLLSTAAQPFDDSIYDSNQIHQVSSKDNLITQPTRKTRRI
ncbi:unnamed protein product [Adineta steineri]|uniref:Uncharacterized protein n=1 Tax=Adineta steineri TaxID=433720 RepID=A0A813NY36_9BILA|nr:unnamed protein product [Adineta steineri]CAF3488396.1 unnamed protein product [Adineta steineri]